MPVPSGLRICTALCRGRYAQRRRGCTHSTHVRVATISVYFTRMSHTSRSHYVPTYTCSQLSSSRYRDNYLSYWPIVPDPDLVWPPHVTPCVSFQRLHRDRLGVLWGQAKVTTSLLPVPILFSAPFEIFIASPSRYGSYEWRLAVTAAPIEFGIPLLVEVYTSY